MRRFCAVKGMYVRERESLSKLLDKPVTGLFHLNLEVCIYVLLAVVAVAACFYNLGERVLSHDECVHSLYSRELYVGMGFVHDPWRHGPFLYHANALVFALFGVGDYTTRVSAALFGVILVLLPVFLRKELGRIGALAVSVMTLISPSTLYYARYIRNEIFMMVWAMLMVIALVRYLDSRKPGWLYLGALAVTLALCTKENAYITGFIGFTYLAMLFLSHVLSERGVRVAYTLGIVLLVGLLVALVALSGFAQTPSGESPAGDTSPGAFTPDRIRQLREAVVLLIGVLLAMFAASAYVRREEQLQPALALLVAYAVVIVALIVACAVGAGLAWLAIVQLPEGIVHPWLFVLLQVLVTGAGLIGGAYAWWRLLSLARKRGGLPPGYSNQVTYVVLALVVVVFTLLYTTFLTNPKGMITGTVGGITYWLAQQEVKRASQPWFYYLIIAPLYEFLPVGLGLAAVIYHVTRAKARKYGATRQVLVAYLVYWTLSAWLIYSWAGEKMPWMMVHIIQPMIVLGGQFVDELLGGVGWREAWRKGGGIVVLITPVLLLAVGMVVGLPLFGQAFRETEDTLRWLSALLVGGGLAVVAWLLRGRLGVDDTKRMVLVAVLALGAVFTVRYSWLANYVNHDTAKEFLVYSHGAPGAKQAIQEIREISRRLYGDPSAIQVAYGADGTCPFKWYLDRHFPNSVYFGTEPTRQSTDVPVLVVGQPEVAKVEPYLGNRYLRFDRKYLWFPHEDYYKRLSLAMPPEEERSPSKNYFLLDMQDPQKRRAFLDVVFYRRYDQSLADWEPSNPGKFAFYVRKDVAAQLWDLGGLVHTPVEE
jgi:uncharacterized protein (TIGR03663 family)